MWSSSQLLASGFSITTFGEDESGELYAANANDGTIHHVLGSMAPRLNAAGVVNSATYQAGLVAGSLVTAFVAGVLDDLGVLTSNSGVSVAVNGIPSPVVAVANARGQEQVNFQAPFEIAGSGTATVVVTRAGQSSAPVIVPVLSVQPGIYSLAHNSDFSPVSAGQPLQRGEFAVLFASGLGAVSNPPQNGIAAPLAPLAVAQADIHVMLGGLPCDVPVAGFAPGILGVYQVNFRVPPNAPPGSHDILLTAGAAVSPAIQAQVQ
jgi:uncharacterized protein (TIGR03437 family)